MRCSADAEILQLAKEDFDVGFLGLSAPTNLAPTADGEDELPRAPEESFSFAGGEMYFLPPSRQAPVEPEGSGGARGDEQGAQGAGHVRGAIERRASAVAAALGWKTRGSGQDAAADPGGSAQAGGDGGDGGGGGGGGGGGSGGGGDGGGDLDDLLSGFFNVLKPEDAALQIAQPELDLQGILDELNQESYPDDAEGGGAGYTDLSAGGDDSAPVFTACSASEGTGGAYRSLGATSGDDAGGEAGLQVQQSAMRRIRRAMRSTAGAQLLAIVRAASAQQQQQPGATPLAQLKEEIKELKAWLGL